MEIHAFIEKHGIVLDPVYLELCAAGMERMAGSIDPLHTETHVRNVLEFIDVLITNERTLDGANIDFPVLLVSLCWHDVWKTTRAQPRHLWEFVFINSYDGLGSVREFKRHINEHRTELERDESRKICGVILRHPGYEYVLPGFVRRRLLTRHSLEANILRDADKLDGLDIERSTSFKDWYLKEVGRLHPGLLVIVDFWLRRFTTQTSRDLVFAYSRQLFSKQLERYAGEFLDFYTEVYQNPERYFTPTRNPVRSYFKYTPAEYHAVVGRYIHEALSQIRQQPE